MNNISKYKTFCIVPFNMMYSLNNGDYRACCFTEPGVPSDDNIFEPVNAFDTPIEQVWNNKYYQKLRYDLSTGTKNKTCATCWKKEENNEFSHRQKYNSDAGITDAQIETLSAVAISNNGHYSILPKVIQIKTGNLCNLKCIMCNQASSSLIEEEVTQWKEQKIQLPQYIEFIDQYEEKWRGSITDQDAEHLYLNYEKAIIDCDELQLVGGEPLVSPENKQLIKMISETEYAKNISIQLNTNATHFNASFVEQLKKFKKINIDASIDDIGPRIEYARHGSKWEILDNNLKKYNSVEEIKLNIWATVNNYNIWYLDDLINYCDENNIELSLVDLHTPSELSIQHLPEYLKDAIREKYSKLPHMSERLAPIINFLDISNDNCIKDFLKTTWIYDRIRKEKFKDVFPEWRDMIYYG